MLNFQAKVINMDTKEVVKVFTAKGKTGRVINNKVNKNHVLRDLKKNEYLVILENNNFVCDCFCTGLQDYSCTMSKELKLC